MSTLADQIRELQLRLEQINEEEPPAPAQSAMNVASDNIPQASAVMAQPAQDLPTNEIPTIEAPTFSQAYAQAKKQGLKKFKWCGVYAVKDPVRPQPAATSNVQPRFYSQGPSDAVLKDKFGRPLPKANQDLIRKSYDDSSSAGGAAG